MKATPGSQTTRGITSSSHASPSLAPSEAQPWARRLALGIALEDLGLHFPEDLIERALQAMDAAAADGLVLS